MDAETPLAEGALKDTALQALSDSARAALLQSGEVRMFESGQVLYHDGQAAGVVLFPLSGVLQMGKATLRGRRQIICQPDGSQCGGICLLLFHDPALAEVRGLKPGRVLVLERTVFQQQIRGDPALCKLAWECASNCMAHLSDLIAQLSFNTVRERVAQALLNDTAQDGDMVRLTQAELAAEVGTTREVAARCLGELQAAGWVRLGRGRITVLRRDALHAVL